MVSATTQQFTAIVANATTQTVNWSVSGAPGGNSTVGLIGVTGFYTAPAVPPLSPASASSCPRKWLTKWI